MAKQTNRKPRGRYRTRKSAIGSAAISASAEEVADIMARSRIADDLARKYNAEQIAGLRALALSIDAELAEKTISIEQQKLRPQIAARIGSLLEEAGIYDLKRAERSAL